MLNIIFESVTSIILVIMVGYFLKKQSIINISVTKSLTDILLKILIPCTLILSFQIPIEDNIYSIAIFAILLSLIMHLLFLLIGYITVKVFKINDNDKGVVIFSIAFVNISFMGFPLLTSVFKDNTINPIFFGSLFFIPFTILMFSVGIKIINSGLDFKISKKDFLTPINFSILIGLLLFSFNITIPSFLSEPINILANATTPLSLLVTGSIIADCKLNSFYKNKVILITSFIRLIVCPVVFYLIFFNFSIDKYLFNVGLLLSTLPTGALTVIIADRYDANKELASQLILTTTILSLFTIMILSVFIR